MGIKRKTSVKPKLIVVLGPTASGKTSLAIRLAKEFRGEVVSADSRQVYRGMDIGTGKVTKKEMQGIPHYLLDVVSPKNIFTVARYRSMTLKKISQISKRNKIPVLCGGTGFYIQAITDGTLIPEVAPDWKFRQKMARKSNAELFALVKKLDPERAKNIDPNNPRRLIRALEIVIKTKKPVPCPKTEQQFDLLLIGIKRNPEELKNLIQKRLIKRLHQGMVAEVKKLHSQGVSWKRLEDFGLEYRYVSRYLTGGLKYKEMVQKLQKEIEHYSKRQMTWFKRDKRIFWVKNYKEAEVLTKRFIKN